VKSNGNSRILYGCVAVLLCVTPVLACNPSFLNTVLDQPAEALRAPTFAFDLTGILPTNSNWQAGPFGTKTNECRAAYLRGRQSLGVNDREAIQWFRRARKRASKTHTDSALAASSLGWEARAEMNRGNLIRAGELYVEHYATGSPTARMSLRIVAGKLLESNGETLRVAARHPALCRVITVYLAARGGPFQSEPPREQAGNWLTAVESTGAINLDCADRLAWAAYQAGDFERAKRWLVRAVQPSASTGWLRTKLLLRDGKMDEATATLARTVDLFPESTDWPNATKYKVDRLEPVGSLGQALGELAALRLGRREYRESLELLLRAGYWTDAAHIAERVLTVDELLDYASQTSDEKLQYLLARRLTRLGRYAEARPFFPENLRRRLDEFTTALANHDAASLWQAAQILRTYGFALTGAELDPDWFIHGGSYDRGFDSSNRLAHAAVEVKPFLRFHYRYRAAELAWEAATQMPDNTDETARILCEAGSWLKDRDPPAADRFYKALVRRCGDTPLGQEAERCRWFP
jgi:tetratricopeptide (TPR) repeat protein